MSFLDTFSAALPHEIRLEDLKILVPSQWWHDKPEQAAVSALCRCGKFDTQDYLERYPDVAQKGLDPVLHFVQHGIAEKRHFKCLPDTNWGQSKVRLAYEYFQKGEHEKALQVYEELSEQMGEKNFVANIAICKKKLGSKESLPALAKGISKPKPKVSVLIPVYNNAQYLHECIDSVINQTLKEIEIIIINDGSTDPEAVRILNDYAAKDDRIKLIHKQNTGYGHSMNVGLDNATGEYIGIVESDDYVDTKMYETLYNEAKKKGIEIIKANYSEIYGDIKNRKYINKKIFSKESSYLKIVSPKYNLWIFKGIILNQLGIFEKQFIDKHKIRFNETSGASFQDNGFFFQSMVWAKKVYFIDKNFYYLRRDNENSSVKDKNKVLCIQDEFKYIRNFLEKNNCDKEFFYAYNVRKFISYSFHNRRIDNKYDRLFYKIFEKEMKEGFCKNEIDLRLFAESERLRLNNMVGDNIYKKVQPKISIIIPIYNESKLLRFSIDSALNQDLEDIEIICIDDGSTDNSLEVIKKICQKYKKIRYCTQSNSGAGAARNKGIEISIGQYISFLDADDIYPSKDVLSKLYSVCKYRCVDVAGGRLAFLDGNTIKLSTNEQDLFPKYGLLDYDDCQFDYGYYRYIYSSKLLKSNNILFPDLKRFQDPPFFVAAMSKAKFFYAINIDSYCYRHNKSKVSWDENKIFDLLCGIEMVLKIAKDKNYTKLYNITMRRLDNDFKKRIERVMNSKKVLDKYLDIKNF